VQKNKETNSTQNQQYNSRRK